jgi:disulfide bond formation protein DsbB
MSFTTVTTVLAVLALIADALVVLTLLALVVSRVSGGADGWWPRLRLAVAPFALPLAFVAAAIAMAGSLYLSEVVHLTPCRLCWYQRICMYPLVLLLGIAMVRRDLDTARRYLVPLAGVGALISAYHYQLERAPQQPTLSCGLGEPSCSQPVLGVFGFVSVPFLALAAFLLIVTAVMLAREPELSWADDEGDEEDRAGLTASGPEAVAAGASTGAAPALEHRAAGPETGPR